MVNIIVMACHHYDIKPVVSDVLSAISYAIVGIFVVEAALKITAFRYKYAPPPPIFLLS